MVRTHGLIIIQMNDNTMVEFYIIWYPFLFLVFQTSKVHDFFNEQKVYVTYE